MAFPQRIVGVLVLVAVTASVFPSSEAAATSRRGTVDPAHPGQCKLANGNYMRHGEKRQGPGCSSTSCFVEVNDYYVNHIGCGLVFARPPCRLASNKVPHPGCCPYEYCGP
ncbi:U-scoloptoxin(16)-Er13a [Oratosquilla oratoria]|uniref:U-scoloptoxin(16)-Er13a n=1 Tax=Oratosquilla oratoria TaxID=337810 RepID=UPI003F75D0AF